jgi:nucleoside 2-deoxyribosyltransferase
MVSKFLNPFRPDLTPESDEYNIKKNYDAVLNVVNANIKGITDSNYLVFPNRTTDLGTLWEVGHAIAYNRPIIKFDEESNKYLVELINEPNIRFKDMNGEFFMFDCTNKLDAISLGYLSKFVNPDRIYYQLKGMPDNIMLSVNYHHVEFDETGELVEYERDKEDEDR